MLRRLKLALHFYLDAVTGRSLFDVYVAWGMSAAMRVFSGSLPTFLNL